MYNRYSYIQSISCSFRDCRLYENLVRHICVAPPHQPIKRVKRILDFVNGSNEISDLLKELEGVTKKGGVIKSGMMYPKFEIANESVEKNITTITFIKSLFLL